MDDYRRTPLEEGADPPVGTHAILFAAGFLIALGSLWVAHALGSYPSVHEMKGPSVLWVTLFCTQVGAWTAVGAWAVVSAKSMMNRVDTARRIRIGAALVLLVALCLVFFNVFISREIITKNGSDPGLSTRIAGLGPIWATVSYVTLLVVSGALLTTHAALQRSDLKTLAMHEQIGTLRLFTSRLRTLLLGAGLLVGLSSASAVALNRARGNALEADYLVIHGALYSILLALLYVPAHITLVRKARMIADRLPGAPPSTSEATAPDERKQLEEDLGLRLTGVPGWDIVASILVPLAASFLGR